MAAAEALDDDSVAVETTTKECALVYSRARRLDVFTMQWAAMLAWARASELMKKEASTVAGLIFIAMATPRGFEALLPP
jgi:hypothetical protein